MAKLNFLSKGSSIFGKLKSQTAKKKYIVLNVNECLISSEGHLTKYATRDLVYTQAARDVSIALDAKTSSFIKKNDAFVYALKYEGKMGYEGRGTMYVLYGNDFQRVHFKYNIEKAVSKNAYYVSITFKQNYKGHKNVLLENAPNEIRGMFMNVALFAERDFVTEQVTRWIEAIKRQVNFNKLAELLRAQKTVATNHKKKHGVDWLSVSDVSLAKKLAAALWDKNVALGDAAKKDTFLKDAKKLFKDLGGVWEKEFKNAFGASRVAEHMASVVNLANDSEALINQLFAVGEKLERLKTQFTQGQKERAVEAYKQLKKELKDIRTIVKIKKVKGGVPNTLANLVRLFQAFDLMIKKEQKRKKEMDLVAKELVDCNKALKLLKQKKLGELQLRALEREVIRPVLQLRDRLNSLEDTIDDKYSDNELLVNHVDRLRQQFNLFSVNAMQTLKERRIEQQRQDRLRQEQQRRNQNDRDFADELGNIKTVNDIIEDDVVQEMEFDRKRN